LRESWNSHAGRFEPGWNEIDVGKRAQQGFLDEVIRAIAHCR